MWYFPYIIWTKRLLGRKQERVLVMKGIQKVNDFVLGLLMIGLSAFLVFGKLTEAEVKTGQGGFLARSDIWLRMIGVFLFIVSVLLIIRACRGKEKEPFHFHMDTAAASVMAMLILYAIIMPYLGFMITTFISAFYLVVLFSIKEKSYTFKTFPKSDYPKMLRNSAITAAVMLLAFWFIFAELLSVKLPGFDLF